MVTTQNAQFIVFVSRNEFLHDLSDVHSVGQKSIALKFLKSRTGSDMRYSCHHNSCPHSRSLIAKEPCSSPGASMSTVT
jgi:hypothetical protein